VVPNIFSTCLVPQRTRRDSSTDSFKEITDASLRASESSGAGSPVAVRDLLALNRQHCRLVAGLLTGRCARNVGRGRNPVITHFVNAQVWLGIRKGPSACKAAADRNQEEHTQDASRCSAIVEDSEGTQHFVSGWATGSSSITHYTIHYVVQEKCCY
jgi:hypothetical protein